MPATLVFGVLLDAFTFQNINITSTFILLGIYFAIASGTLVWMQAYDAHRLPHYRAFEYLRLLSPLVVQLTYGALLSGVFIFYFFSGTFFVSWLLLALLVLLMVSNDVFKKYYSRITIQLGVYYFILFTLSTIFVAFATQSLSAKVFVIAGVSSLVFMFGFAELLMFANKDIQKFRIRVASTILTLFVFLNALYFAKLIPPIPLSIREMSLAHSIEKNASGYTVSVEPRTWWQKLFQTEVFHKSSGESVYVYTAIFAPGKLQTKIIHEWKYFDETKKEWVNKSDLSFVLTGGRSQGFRGFSFKNNVPAGKWRVYVKTANGQVLGRMSFVVESVDQKSDLSEQTK